MQEGGSSFYSLSYVQIITGRILIRAVHFVGPKSATREGYRRVNVDIFVGSTGCYNDTPAFTFSSVCDSLGNFALDG